mmetsp:Transcript_268/g.484  ORF Transcript_268/g.484 Transcript_268/m.484 type:complete len:254 (+) Transcript_268:171-932(+)
MHAADLRVLAPVASGLVARPQSCGVKPELLDEDGVEGMTLLLAAIEETQAPHIPNVLVGPYAQLLDGLLAEDGLQGGLVQHADGQEGPIALHHGQVLRAPADQEEALARKGQRGDADGVRPAVGGQGQGVRAEVRVDGEPVGGALQPQEHGATRLLGGGLGVATSNGPHQSVETLRLQRHQLCPMLICGLDDVLREGPLSLQDGDRNVGGLERPQADNRRNDLFRQRLPWLKPAPVVATSLGAAHGRSCWKTA